MVGVKWTTRMRAGIWVSGSAAKRRAVRISIHDKIVLGFISLAARAHAT